MSRLALGTVQFGLDYGVSNPSGRLSPGIAADIVAAARANSIDTFDTSPAYGTSEEVLGGLLPAGSRVVSKVARIQEGPLGPDAVEACASALNRSLRLLRRDSLYGLMVHWAEDLLRDGSEALYAWMLKAKAEGKVARIGVSVYDAGQIDRILAKFPVDLVQLPLSVLDQRLLRSGHLAMLKERGVEVHVRSVFLQGLLLMGMDDLPAYFGRFRDILERLHGTAARAGLTPLELSLGFAMGIPEVDKIVVGVNSVSQLEEIIAASKIVIQPETLQEVASDEVGLLNPSRWELTRK